MGNEKNKRSCSLSYKKLIMYAVIVRADKNLPYYNLTMPIIEKYVIKMQSQLEIKIELVILNEKPPFWTSDNKPHYRILRVLDSDLANYDRYLFLDADILIRKDCPNLFSYVNENYIGSIVEDIGSRRSARLKVMREIQKRFFDISWESDYTNAGIQVLSNCHLKILEPINGEYWKGWGSVDAHMGFNIKRYGFQIQYLSYKFNHMAMFSEPWNKMTSRFSSYIIHYAGQANFPGKGSRTRYQLIKDDYNYLKNKGLIDD